MPDATTAPDLGPRYAPMARLGEGGMGVVWRVLDRETDKEVALKAMLPEVAQDEAAHLNFQQEFRAMARIRHANTCAVYDFGRLPDGGPYFTMELVPGEDLKALLPMGAEEGRKVLAQVGAALGAIHRAGYVHADLKPENIRVRPDGVVKLMDFGLMTPVGQVPEAVRGTLTYIAPEAVRCDRLDGRADLYALGVMAHELMVGRPPFVAEGPVALAKAHLNAAPPPLRALNPQVSASLERAVLALLAKDPGDRPATAAAALAAMGVAAEEAGPPSLLAPPFVGRAAELVALKLSFEAVQAGGAGATRWVEAPEGLGKSRLLQELRTAVTLEEAPAWAGLASSEGRPFEAFLAPLRSAWPLLQAADPARAEALAAVVGALLPELTPPSGLAPLEPEQLKARLVAAIAEALGLAAQRTQGALLVLDGWEQADAPSQEVLAELTRREGGQPLLVVVGTRHAAGKLSGAERVALGPLSEAEVGELAAGMLGLERIPEGALVQLLALSEGSPAVIAHLIEHLATHGALGQVEGRWVMPELLPAGALPADRQAMVLARVEALGPTAKTLAAFAATHGAPFDLALARGVLGWEADALFDAVEEALRARVLETHGPRYAVEGQHLRELLAAGVDPLQAKAWHGAIAKALPPVASTSDLGDLAFWVEHQLRGEAPVEALVPAWWLAERQCGLFHLPAAAATAEAALAVAEAVGEAAPLEARWGLRVVLATVRHWRMELAGARELLTQAEPLAQALAQAGRPEALVEVAFGWGKNGALEGTSSSIAAAIPRFEEVIQEGRRLGLGRTEMRAFVNLGRVLFFSGQHAKAREVLAEAVARAEALNTPLAGATARSFLGYLQVVEGPASREEGLANLEAAIAVQRAQEDRGGLSYSHNLRFEVFHNLGRLKEALGEAEANATLSLALGSVDDHTIGLLNQALVQVEMGRFAEGDAVAQRVVAAARASQHGVALPIGLALAADVAAHVGRWEEALSLAQEAEGLARDTSGYVYTIAFPYVVEALLRLGQVPPALNVAQEAQFRLRSMENHDAEVRMWTALAEVHARMGAHDQARTFAAKAVEGALDADAKALLSRALVAKATAAWGAGQGEEAQRAAEQGLSLSRTVGDLVAEARLSGIMGEIMAQAGGADEAGRHFQGMQKAAEAMGDPYLKAVALAALGALPGAGEAGVAMLGEAQRRLKELSRLLPEEEQGAFLAQREVAGVLDRIPGVSAGGGPTVEAGQATLDRLGRIGLDLQAVATQYGNLLKEWATKSTQLEALNALARQINETLDVPAVLTQVVQLTLQITKAERGFLYLKDEAAPEGVTCAAAFNQFGRPIAHERGSQSACQKVMASGTPLMVMDAMADEEFQASKSIMALNLRTLMAVPLQAKGHTLGVLYVDSQAVVTAFTSKDLELLEAIAMHAAVAIENARLYEALNKRAAELESALEMYRKADRDANTDLLTGLRNRRYFEDQSAREIEMARRSQRPLSVIILDVDHFKKFNDTYGHAIGDEVLKAMGRVLPEAVRTTDVPARFGGEEFVALCPDTDAEGALMVAERIRQAVMAVVLNDAEGKPVRQITASLGVAQWGPDDGDVHSVLERADAALYACKGAGRNCAMIWRADMVGA